MECAWQNVVRESPAKLFKAGLIDLMHCISFIDARLGWERGILNEISGARCFLSHLQCIPLSPSLRSPF